jgi:hypothetical protein
MNIRKHTLVTISKKLKKIEKEIKQSNLKHKKIEDTSIDFLIRINKLECLIENKMNTKDFYCILEPYQKDNSKLYNENIEMKKMLRKKRKK